MFDNSSIPNRPEPTLDDLDLNGLAGGQENGENDELAILQLGESEKLRIQKAYEIYTATHQDSIPVMREVKFFADSGPEVIGLPTSAYAN